MISTFKYTSCCRIISGILIICFLGITTDLHAFTPVPSETQEPAAGDIAINRTSAFDQLMELIQTLRAEIIAAEARRIRDPGRAPIAIDYETAIQKLDLLAPQIREDLQNMKKALQRAGYSARIIRRLDEFVKKFDTGIAELRRILVRGSAREFLQFYNEEIGLQPVVHNPLSTHSLKSLVTEQTLSNQLNAYQKTSLGKKKKTPVPEKDVGKSAVVVKTRDFTESPPTPDDLSETPEIQFTSDIQALAESLDHSPAQIYTYLHDYFTYEPYFGSLKGAYKTFLDRQANDIDMASLLMALLRVSSVPCRYMNGVVRIPIEQAMQWVKTQDPQQAVFGFTRRGIPSQAVYEGGQVTALLIHHTWVIAFVDYEPGRGIHNTDGDTWIELDPSFKQFTFGEARDLASEVGIDPQPLKTYIQYHSIVTEHSATAVPDSHIQAQLAVWRELVRDYAQANNLSPEDVFARQDIVSEKLELLPATLPYPVLARYTQVSEMHDSLRHKIIVNIADEFDTVCTVDLSLKRFTVSYAPASAEDTTLVRQYLETDDPLPGYLIRLMPRVMLDTAVVMAPVNEYLLGMSHEMKFSFHAPSFPAVTTSRFLQTGGFYVLGLDLQQTSQPEIETKHQHLFEIQSLLLSDPDALCLGDVMGEPLGGISRSYFYAVDRLNQLIASCLDASVVRLPSLNVVGYDLKVLTWMGAPYEVTSAKVSMSVDKNTLIPISLSGDPQVERRFMLVSGLATAAMEHNAFEQNIGGQAASTVRMIRKSNQDVVPIYTIDQQNLAFCMSQLVGYPEYIKERIQNEVNAGKVVTAPQTPVVFAGWDGTAYIAMDPETGYSSFTLFGHLAGAVETCDFVNCAKLILYEGSKTGYTQLCDRVVSWLGVCPEVNETISFAQVPGLAAINDWFLGGVLDKTTYIASCIAIDDAIAQISGRPNFVNVDVSPAFVSPNADGMQDTLYMQAFLSRPSNYTISIIKSDTVAVLTGAGTLIDTFWTGPGTDGDYVACFDAVDTEFGTQAITVTRPFTLDNAAPAVLIASPQPFVTVSGIIQITGTASDNNFQGYTISVSQADSFRTIAEASTPVLSGVLGNWNSVNVENGEHVLRLLARDRAGNRDSTQITIYTDNESVDVTPPEVAMLSPQPGDTLSDTMLVGVLAIDSAGISWVKALCDTSVFGYQDTGWQSPGTFVLLSYSFDNAQHRLWAQAQDSNSNIGTSDSVTVFFDNFIHNFTAAPDPFSPNNDEYNDVIHISADMKQSVDYALYITDTLGTALDSVNGSDMYVDYTWDGLDGSMPYPDALYCAMLYTEQDTAAISFELLTGIYPIAVITAPQDGSEISGMVSVTGTATAEQFEEYTLRMKQVAAEEWKTLKHSTEPVVDGQLGIIDATTLLNDAYLLQLEVKDPLYTSTIEYTIYVHSDLKVGNFTITQRDVSIPLAGLPIEFTRTYSSQNKTRGDFGYGWSMDYAGGLVLDEHQNVTLTLPDGRREVFFIEVHLTGWMSYSYIRFHSSSSVYDSLHWDVVDYLFEEDKLTLHTAQGARFHYFEGEIDSIIDRVGNKLAFTDSGITHSSGKGVKFLRNPDGFISDIVTPEQDTFHYEYADGNLVRIVNPEAETISYSYDGARNLIDIKDPRGVTPIRNEYDDAGKLVRHIDAAGDTIEYIHDPDHNTETVIDRMGNPTVYEYDDDGLVTAITNPEGEATTYAYDENKNRISETNALGQTTLYEYDAHGNRTRRADPLGNSTQYAYNQYGQVLSETNPLGHVTSHEYDSKGNLIKTTDPLGKVMTFEYDLSGNLTSQTDALGQVTRYSYDGYGNLIMTVSASGDTARFAYDLMGNKTLEVNAKNDTSHFVYDAVSRMIASINPLGDTTHYEYDLLGNQKAVIDPLGRRTENVYNLRGELIKTIYPDSTFIENIYDANGNRIAVKNQVGETTQYVYDDAGRMIKTIFPDGSMTQTEYDDAGRTKKTINQLGGFTYFYYDAAGRQTKVIDPAGNVTQYQYDDAGRRIAFIDALGHTTTSSYSATGQLVKTTYPDGSTVVYTYDDAGRKIAERDQAMNTTRFMYDESGRLLGVIDAKDDTTRYEYDELGNRIAQIDANNNRTEFEYDVLGRMTKMTYPGGDFEAYGYNAVGSMLWKRDCNDDTVWFAYDSMSRLRKKTYPDADSVVYTYTATGRRETVLDENGLTGYSYGVMDRLERIDLPGGKYIEYRYDVAGNRTKIITQDGTTTYQYDKISRLIKVTDPEGMVMTYEYDAVGNRARVMYPNNTYTEYTYNTLNRLVKLSNKKVGEVVLSSYDYTLGPTGNRTRIIENTNGVHDTLNYVYDNVYRLLSEKRTGAHAYEITYEYDKVGNRLSKIIGSDTTEYVYNNRDQLIYEILGTDTTAYDYDNNGNTIQKTHGSSGLDYSYDFENRLLQADSNSTLVSKYGYDSDGNKIKVMTPSDSTNFLNDINQPLAQVLAEYNNSGAVIVSYLYGDDLISQNRGGTKSYYHYDGLGSTRLLTDPNGLITDQYIFYAFGTLLSALGSTQNNYLFAGEQFDPNLGFYYLRARLYNPAIGRFLTTDPFEGSIYDPMSLHKYLYCNADPVNNIDPSGYFSTINVLMTAALITWYVTIALPLFMPSAIEKHMRKTTKFIIYNLIGGIVGWYVIGGGIVDMVIEEVYENFEYDKSVYTVFIAGLGYGTPELYFFSTPTEFETDRPMDSSEFSGVGWLAAVDILPVIPCGFTFTLAMKIPKGPIIRDGMSIAQGIGIAGAVSFVGFWFRKKIM